MFTFPAILFFIIFNGLSPGEGGFGHALGGFAVGFGLFLPAFVAGVLGAGDVKLMAAAGAALGPAGALWAVLFTSLAGGLYAVAVLATRRGELSTFAVNFKHSVLAFAGTRSLSAVKPQSTDTTLPRLCYGVAIAIGAGAAAACTILECPLPGLG